MRLSIWIYILTVPILWLIPLFNVVHVESGAVVATISFFVAGLSVSKQFSCPTSVLADQIFKELRLLLIPLVGLTFSAFWISQCDYINGLGFFLLFTTGSVIFGVTLAWFLTGFNFRRPKIVFFLIGLLILVISAGWDFLFHPQFYVYNHIFGGILGPIYDFELAIRPGLFWFRFLTILWSLVFIFSGLLLRFPSVNQKANLQIGLTFTLLVISVFYFNGTSLGFNTTENHLQKGLSGKIETAHFDIFFDPQETSPADQDYLARYHEYHYDRIATLLADSVSGRITSFIYPSPQSKAAFTGAAHTSVTPVYLAIPQMHIVRQYVEQSFAHELAHVFSRNYGLTWLGLPVSAGLLEGFAVALEPPKGVPSPHDQVAAAQANWASFTDEKFDLATAVSNKLSPFGFWSGRSAVSYTTMGSFVKYLLDTYGAEKLKQVYKFANFKDVYGKPLITLADEWQFFITNEIEIRDEAIETAEVRFSRLSLFEASCPHYIPPAVKILRLADQALSDSLYDLAHSYYLQLDNNKHKISLATVGLSLLDLIENKPEKVVDRLQNIIESDSLTPVNIQLYFADALVLLKDSTTARRQYNYLLSLMTEENTINEVLRIRILLAGRPDVMAIRYSKQDKFNKAVQLSALPNQSPFLQLIQLQYLLAAEDYQNALVLINRIDESHFLTSNYYKQLEIRVLSGSGQFNLASLKLADLANDEDDLDLKIYLRHLAKMNQWWANHEIAY